MKKDDPKWLETIVAVDDSVIQFHGSKTVKRYILTLLNIVSAIYGDPTLGADLKFVILRLIFFEGSASFNPIDQSDSKQSLENVNRYVLSGSKLCSNMFFVHSFYFRYRCLVNARETKRQAGTLFCAQISQARSSASRKKLVKPRQNFFFASESW